MANKRATQETLARRRSWVRVWVTYGAALYIFVGSGVLIYLALRANSVEIGPLDLTGITPEKLANMEKAVALAKQVTDGTKEMFDHARDIFMLVLPVATSIITYWFASQSPAEERETTAPEPAPATGPKPGAQPAAGAGAVGAAETADSADEGKQQVSNPKGNEQRQGDQGAIEDATVDQVSHDSQPLGTDTDTTERGRSGI